MINFDFPGNQMLPLQTTFMTLGERPWLCGRPRLMNLNMILVMQQYLPKRF